MEDLGAPSSYLALEKGTAVFARDGEKLGSVEHVLADENADVFDGIVLDTSVLPGGHRFVDASRVAEIHERGVLLDLEPGQAEQLPEPGPNPAALRVNPADAEESELMDKLRRAWDRISGNY